MLSKSAKSIFQILFDCPFWTTAMSCRSLPLNLWLMSDLYLLIYRNACNSWTLALQDVFIQDIFIFTFKVAENIIYVDLITAEERRFLFSVHNSDSIFTDHSREKHCSNPANISWYTFFINTRSIVSKHCSNPANIS